jgi:nitronate monooxygenase
VSVSLRTQACVLLGCEHPVVLAGMGGVARSELVAAVAQAGGFGFLGMVREPPSLIRREVEAVRRLTQRSFGINLIPAATDSELLEQQLGRCIELGVPVVALFWDLVPGVVERLRDAGILVVCQVGSPEEGDSAQRAGAQILIAQGMEAGGHVRGTTPLKSLLPAVIACSDVPVLAAGGIVDGGDLADSVRSGADGVVIGTAFLASPESFAHDYHKQRVVQAKSKETILTDIFHINWPIGAPVRVLQNSVTRGERGDPFGLSQIIGEEEGRPIYLFSTDSPLRSMTGDFEGMALYAGQGVDKIDAIVPAGERLKAIVSEATQLLQVGTD